VPFSDGRKGINVLTNMQKRLTAVVKNFATVWKKQLRWW
jgi:hypothetical protein